MTPRLYITAGLIAVAIGGAFAGGFKTKSVLVKAALAETLEAQKATHTESLNKLQTELDEAAAETLRLSEELDYAQSNVRTVTRTIIKEVPKYVQDSTPDCDRRISINALRLLDSAARGAVAYTDSAETSPDDVSNTLSGGVTPPRRYPTE